MKILMFHYVTKNFNYYHFDLEEFENIVKKLATKKFFITFSDVDKMLKNKEALTEDYIMFTFDDGTIDQYYNAYKTLKNYHLKGVFYLCNCFDNNQILDINIIHQLIAKVDFNVLYAEFLSELKMMKIDVEQYNKPCTDKIAYFKQMLQTLLPENIRKTIIQNLLKTFNVNVSDIYIDLEKLKEMKNAGMEFGLHTVSHPRLSYLNYESQEKEIYNNYQLLKKYNLLDDIVSIAYPFGDYNDDTINILKKLNINYAVTVTEGNFTSKDDKYKIKRYDCKNYQKII